MKEPIELIRDLRNVRLRLDKLQEHLEKLRVYTRETSDKVQELLEDLPAILEETEEKVTKAPQKIIDATQDILREAGRPMKVREILDALSEKSVTIRAKNKYVSLYNGCVGRKDIFRRTGEGEFALVEGEVDAIAEEIRKEEIRKAEAEQGLKKTRKTKGRPKKKG